MDVSRPSSPETGSSEVTQVAECRLQLICLLASTGPFLTALPPGLRTFGLINRAPHWIPSAPPPPQAAWLHRGGPRRGSRGSFM